MRKITWPHCVGQLRVKEVLEAAIGNNSLGHAYLFAGPEGCGKFAAALDLALLLQCTGKMERPCMKCLGCKRVLDYAHPDFHVIMPVVLGKEHRGDEGELSTNGWEYVATEVKSRINDPYMLPDHEKVPDIPVGWLREVNHTINAGMHEGRANVAILDGVESLKKESANTMLKLLEEPPAGTVLLLITDRISAVLPTIVSRCQVLRFAWLPAEEIRAELSNRFGSDAGGRNMDAIANTGSLGKSLLLWKNPPDEMVAEVSWFLDLCRQSNWMEIAASIDRMVAWEDFGKYEQFFLTLMETVREAFLHDLPGLRNVFLSPSSGQEKAALPYDEVASLLRVCERSIAATRSRANILLVLTNCAIAATEAFNAKKQ